MFTVSSLTDLFIETTNQTVAIWDCGKDEEVFTINVDSVN